MLSSGLLHRYVSVEKGGVFGLNHLLQGPKALELEEMQLQIPTPYAPPQS